MKWRITTKVTEIHEVNPTHQGTRDARSRIFSPRWATSMKCQCLIKVGMMHEVRVAH